MPSGKPLRLAQSFKEKVWGSTRLGPWFADSRGRTGEVWYTTDPPLPILVKLLFTEENLSVQVHPKGEAGIGKTEMWHILRADPGARIALGFRERLTRERVREASLSGEIERLLNWIPVQAGETYFTPAGTVHAIGAGLALCEIQQNSDITYRLYDYGRPRELHLDEGVVVSELGTYGGTPAARVLNDGWTQLVRCSYFATDAATLTAETECAGLGDWCLLICLEGGGTLDGETVRAGEVWLAPQARFTFRPLGSARLLRTYVPNSGPRA